MKKITKFQAIDGAEFHDKVKCIDYENLIKEVKAIIDSLLPIPKMNGCDFENGHGFVQQDKESVKRVRNKLLQIAKRYITHHWIDQSLESETVHPSYAGRLISEMPFLNPLYSGWNRISNMDAQFREWGQGYFAANPDESPALKLKN